MPKTLKRVRLPAAYPPALHLLQDRHLVVSYSRKRFGQSGDGHFSPVGAFHGGRGLVLVLDVARFKYGPHWVGVADLMEAMDMEDPATGGAGQGGAGVERVEGRDGVCGCSDWLVR